MNVLVLVCLTVLKSACVMNLSDSSCLQQLEAAALPIHLSALQVLSHDVPRNIYSLMVPFQDAEHRLFPELYLCSAEGWRVPNTHLSPKYRHVAPIPAGGKQQSSPGSGRET